MPAQLHGKRILITRPAHQAQGWRELLAAAGANVDAIPMLGIEPIREGPAAQAIKNRILDFDQYHHAIFVSQNAVRLGFDWLDDYWPQLPQGPRFYAIGAATGRMLRERGAEADIADGAMDSETLLALPALQDIAGQRALIFRGQGGRTLIGDTLRRRGARVDHCEIYRRVLPANAIEQLTDYTQLPDAISVHSGETLENLALCIEQSGRTTLRRQPLVCPSERVAARAHALGFVRVSVAANAGDSAMLAALEDALTAPRG